MSAKAVDLDQFRIKADGETPADAEPFREGVDFGGQSVDPDEDRCVAKMTVNPQTGTDLYFVRACTAGFRANQFFNPQEHDVTQLSQTNRSSGRPWYEFRRVNAEAYREYVRFLRTQNAAHLKLAERAV